MSEGAVDLAEGGFDRAVSGGVRRRCGGGSEGGEGAEQAGTELDQEDAKLQAACGQAIAPGPADALNQTVGAELTEVVAELGEAVVGLGKAVALEEARQDVTGGPVGDEAAGAQQDVEQSDQPIIMQADAGHAAHADLDRLGEAGELALVNGAGQ